jgi:hypothetical protein
MMHVLIAVFLSLSVLAGLALGVSYFFPTFYPPLTSRRVRLVLGLTALFAYTLFAIFVTLADPRLTLYDTKGLAAVLATHPHGL